MKLTHTQHKKTRRTRSEQYITTLISEARQIRLTRLSVHLDTSGYWKLCTLASLKIYFFFYKVCPELYSRNTIHNTQLRHRMIL